MPDLPTIINEQNLYDAKNKESEEEQMTPKVVDKGKRDLGRASICQRWKQLSRMKRPTTTKSHVQMVCGANNSSIINIDSIEFVMCNFFLYIFIGGLEFHIRCSLRSRRVCFQSWLLLYKTS